MSLHTIPMMSGTLYVEGTDDCHTIIHLLQRHGVDLSVEPRSVTLKEQGSATKVLETIPVAVKGSGTDPVGFILDTDPLALSATTPNSNQAVARDALWASVRHRLSIVDVLPAQAKPIDDELPSTGFIGLSRMHNRRVGVWLMPNNLAPQGTLEDFLCELVPQSDPMFALATRATEEALKVSRTATGSKYIRDQDLLKGQLHSWLSWQESPGRPYGTAIKAKYFNHDTPTAILFVNWFKSLFQIP